MVEIASIIFVAYFMYIYIKNEKKYNLFLSIFFLLNMFKEFCNNNLSRYYVIGLFTFILQTISFWLAVYLIWKDFKKRK